MDAVRPNMISIKELAGKTFWIPVYQRGFRWKRQQIRELVMDLYDFADGGTGTIYCLQNITVRKIGDNTYEVIDGQQRLTAIWILSMMHMFDKARRYKAKVPVYSLVYEEKDGLTDYVKNITDQVTHGADEKKETDILKISAPSDIDSRMIHDAFTYLMESAEFEKDTMQDVNPFSCLEKIFGGDYQDNKKQICVVWNEIDAPGDQEEDKTSAVIGKFSSINANKIPLTESELIKAYFINRLPKEKVAEFTLQWEEMEKGLNNDDLWWFLASDSDLETRIDFLFRIHLAGSAGSPEQHGLSNRMNEELCADPYGVWMKIVQIYNTLLDWYHDYYFYHMIGVIAAVDEAETSKLIRTLYDSYSKSTKKEFRRTLKEWIRKEACYKTPFHKTDKNSDWVISAAENICLEGADNDEISYVKNKAVIKPILLLFNVALLLNAYSKNPENAEERFSFKLYKGKSTFRDDNPIEIEHINPHHLEGKREDKTDYTAGDRKNWALKTLDIITDPDKHETLKERIDAADWNHPDKLGKLIDEIEAAANVNALNNLTLLDKNLNGRYKDYFFDVKRKHILAARFGHPVPGKNGEFYEKSVIFPGTMWVFLRQYITDGGASNTDERWNDADRTAYIRQMRESIYELLKD